VKVTAEAYSRSMADMWSTIATERGALADDLGALSDSQWDTESLCPRWSVRDVLAHMTAAASLNPVTFLAEFTGAGFNFDKFADRRIAKHRGDSPAETLENFRAKQQSTSSPPGPKLTWLGETLVHAEDIRRPLGIQHAYPPDVVRELMDFYKNSDTLIGTKSRINGVTLVATDTDWSHGSGPRVEGPITSLMMVGTGRPEALDELTGEGIEVLRGR
jgi:uncharacterized protein (TIGR03083 family)